MPTFPPLADRARIDAELAATYGALGEMPIPDDHPACAIVADAVAVVAQVP